MRKRLEIALMLCAIQIVCLSSKGLAQQPKPIESQASEPLSKSTSQVEAAPAELQAAIKTLADQVAALGAEVHKLRTATEKNSLHIELLLSEERLARIEDKIESTQDARRALDAREKQQQYRLDNIQQEVLLRGGLDREEGERVIRGDIERQLENIHSDQAANQKRLADLQSQARRLRSRVEEPRKKVDAEEKEQQ